MQSVPSTPLAAATVALFASLQAAPVGASASVDSARSDPITIHSCSALPYPSQSILLDLLGNEIARLPQEAGTCESFTLRVPVEGAILYTHAQPSRSLDRLNRDGGFRNHWQGTPVFSPIESGLVACIDSNSAEFLAFADERPCEPDERVISPAYLSGEQNEFSLLIEDPFVCAQRRPRCANTDGSSLLEWAEDLEQSLEISERAWALTDQYFGLIPTATGLQTTDLNGPFNRGISITERQAERTPLGSPVLAQAGDQIISFNGSPVFDRDDFIMLLIEHGQRGGFETPYQMEVEREGSRYLIEGYTVFHRDIYGSYFLNRDGTCRNTTRALLSAALEEATFYTKPVLACVNFDVENMSASRRRDCEFAVRQLTAAYRQYCPAVSQGGSLVGSIFMPGREVAETVVGRVTAGMLGRLGSALIVEVTEEIARAAITMPPGIRASDNWTSIGQQAAFGVAVGSGFRLLTMN